jgi:hypothetical protein
VAAQWAEGLREWLKPGDPLVTSGMARLSLSATEIGAEMAVASAIRILGNARQPFRSTRYRERRLIWASRGDD